MRLKQIVASILEVDESELSDSSNAQTTPRWDSLRHIEVIFAVESAFQVRFTMPEITSLRNLGDIRRLLIEKNALIETDAEEPLRRTA
jgi:acyl carrier protein